MENIQLVNDNEILLGIVEHLGQKNLSTQKLVQTIQDNIIDHHDQMKNPYIEKDIIESRFISPEDAYKWGVVSCGAVTNIATFILRSLNYEVKLIHGSILNSKTHAWFEIKEENSWKEYDLTNNNCVPFEGRKIEAICNSWEEIRPIIENARVIK